MPKIYKLISHEVAEYIEKYIKDHGLKAHDKLPAERELAACFNITRTTVRQGFQHLIVQGIIYTLPNKGYFVCEPKIERQLISYCFPYSDPLLDLSGYSIKDIDYMSEPIFNICHNMLNVNADSHLITNRFIEYMYNHPVSLTYTIQKSQYISKYPGLFHSRELPTELLQKQSLRVYHPDEQESALLNLNAADSLLLISNCLCNANEPVAVSLSVCVGTRTNLITTVHTDTGSDLL